jgi:hypothetical protein
MIEPLRVGIVLESEGSIQRVPSALDDIIGFVYLEAWKGQILQTQCRQFALEG